MTIHSNPSLSGTEKKKLLRKLIVRTIEFIFLIVSLEIFQYQQGTTPFLRNWLMDRLIDGTLRTSIHYIAGFISLFVLIRIYLYIKKDKWNALEKSTFWLYYFGLIESMFIQFFPGVVISLLIR